MPSLCRARSPIGPIRPFGERPLQLSQRGAGGIATPCGSFFFRLPSASLSPVTAAQRSASRSFTPSKFFMPSFCRARSPIGPIRPFGERPLQLSQRGAGGIATPCGSFFFRLPSASLSPVTAAQRSASRSFTPSKFFTPSFCRARSPIGPIRPFGERPLHI